MSVYICFDEQEGEQAASNKGWGDFSRWVENLAGYDELQAFVVNGFSENIDALKSDIEQAISNDAPADHTILDTAGVVLKILSQKGQSEIALVTNGVMNG